MGTKPACKATPAAELVSSTENTITTTGTIAVLPPCLLWAASMAASTDASKLAINGIDIRRQGEYVRIASVDGHRCFRARFKQSDRFFISSEQTEPFRLNPAAFSRLRASAKIVEIEATGLANFIGRDCQVIHGASWRPVKGADAPGSTFPNIDQLWPEDHTLTCNLGGVIAFNGSYLADFGEIASKLSRNAVVKLFTASSAIQPAIMTATLDPFWMLEENKGSKHCPEYDCEDVEMEYLIMPIQIRTRK